MRGGPYPGREVARRLLILAIVTGIIIVPAIVALAMLMTGYAGP